MSERFELDIYCSKHPGWHLQDAEDGALHGMLVPNGYFDDGLRLVALLNAADLAARAIKRDFPMMAARLERALNGVVAP